VAEREIERVLVALSGAGARYLVVGGVAVVLHGHMRMTRDLDLVVDLDPENLRRVLEVLQGLEYRPRAPVELFDFLDPARRQSWIEQEGMRVFSLWSTRLRTTEVDIFAEPPFDFEEAAARAARVVVGGETVPVVSLEDLLALKLRAGRRVDLDDIEALRRLHPGLGPPGPAGATDAAEATDA